MELQDIVISLQDIRVGSVDEQGNINWPDLDIEGRRYSPNGVTMQWVAPGRFVVIGPDRGRFIGSITIDEHQD